MSISEQSATSSPREATRWRILARMFTTNLRACVPRLHRFVAAVRNGHSARLRLKAARDCPGIRQPLCSRSIHDQKIAQETRKMKIAIAEPKVTTKSNFCSWFPGFLRAFLLKNTGLSSVNSRTVSIAAQPWHLAVGQKPASHRRRGGGGGIQDASPPSLTRWLNGFCPTREGRTK